MSMRHCWPPCYMLQSWTKLPGDLASQYDFGQKIFWLLHRSAFLSAFSSSQERGEYSTVYGEGSACAKRGNAWTLLLQQACINLMLFEFWCLINMQINHNQDQHRIWPIIKQHNTHRKTQQNADSKGYEEMYICLCLVKGSKRILIMSLVNASSWTLPVLFFCQYQATQSFNDIALYPCVKTA